MNQELDYTPIIESLEEGAKDWLQTNTPERIRERVNKKLDAHVDNLILTILGMEYKFGSWAVDHCNGKGRQTEIGDYLSNRIREDVKAWMDQIELPTLTKKVEDSIKEKYKAQLQNTINQKMYEAQKEYAEKFVNDLITQMTAFSDGKNIEKLYELLLGNSNESK
jgi:hypothetical protein